MKKYQHIEQSFQEIRLQTNNSDVREIVAKFMTKEQTYASLIVAVTANEQKYDELREVNKERQNRVRELQLANDNRREIKRPPKDDEKAKMQHDAQMKALLALNDEAEARGTQYAQLTCEEQHLQSELEELVDRKKKMQLVNDQVGGWLKHVAGKMYEQVNGMRLPADERSNIETLREISGLAKIQLAQIKQKQQADDEESLGDKDYIGDFVAQDYVEKNIRVIPMGGIGIDSQSEHTSKYYPSHMGGATADSEADEFKFNEEFKHDWAMKRKKIKDAKMEAERKAAEEAERLAKLKKNF